MVTKTCSTVKKCIMGCMLICTLIVLVVCNVMAERPILCMSADEFANGKNNTYIAEDNYLNRKFNSMKISADNPENRHLVNDAALFAGRKSDNTDFKRNNVPAEYNCNNDDAVMDFLTTVVAAMYMSRH